MIVTQSSSSVLTESVFLFVFLFVFVLCVVVVVVVVVVVEGSSTKCEVPSNTKIVLPI